MTFITNDTHYTNTSIPPSPTTALSDKFASILFKADVFDFTSFSYPFATNILIDDDIPEPAKYFPNEIDTIAHLKLMRALSVMKKNVTRNCNPQDVGRVWNAFVYNAVKRFIVFMSGIKKYLAESTKNNTESVIFQSGTTKNEGFIMMMNQMLPPLDVIMVWHAFASNTKPLYDVLIRSKMIQFANLPLPLHNIVSFISDTSFEFRVSKEFKKNYTDFIKNFTAGGLLDLQYEVEEIKPLEQSIAVYCPNCNDKLADGIPLTTNDHTGFADGDFHFENSNFLAKISDCHCTCFDMLTREELRKLQLYADVKRTGVLQGVFKHYSEVICPPQSQTRNPSNLSIELALKIESRWDDYQFENFRGMIKSLKSEINNPNADVLLMEYLQYNPISMTIPNGGVEIGFDLVQSVMRQERFINKMNNLNWLQSEHVKSFAIEMCHRYQKFFTLLTDPDLQQKTLVPTLDIDLVWHTHKLCLQGYFHDCRNSSCQYVVDDTKHEGKLDDSFKVTIDLYQERFGESYNICYCSHCIAVIATVHDVLVADDEPFEIKSLFGDQASTPFYSTTTSSNASNSGSMSPAPPSPKRRKRSNVFLEGADRLAILNPMTPIDETLEDLLNYCSRSFPDSSSSSPPSLFGSTEASRTVSNSDMTVVDSLFSLTRYSTGCSNVAGQQY
ncbi:hypothetical protein SBY92_003943 [Candida maltosa Xu316]|uniref:Uncharacterized protein n=1 Tax=Candida maltosa (strain Xu316) TaxID=1245528 RepID=M3IQC4_CANMX|nr:hypothetical protein G210_0741 [Candida maltosa Xu316]